MILADLPVGRLIHVENWDLAAIGSDLVEEGWDLAASDWYLDCSLEWNHRIEDVPTLCLSTGWGPHMVLWGKMAGWNWEK